MKGIRNRKKMYIIAFILCMVVVNVGSLIISNADETDVVVKYRTCTESGWYSWDTQKDDGSVEGTNAITRLEMTLEKSDGTSLNNSIKYSVYSKEGDWTEPVSGNGLASSNGKPIKAFKMELSDELEAAYSIEYRACNSNNEWYAWAKNGDVAGDTYSEANLVEIEVKIVKIGDAGAIQLTGDSNQSVTAPQTDTTTNDAVVTTPAPDTTTNDAVVTTPSPENSMETANNEVVITQAPQETVVNQGEYGATLAPGQSIESVIADTDVVYEPTPAPDGNTSEINNDTTVTTEESVEQTNDGTVESQVSPEVTTGEIPEATVIVGNQQPVEENASEASETTEEQNATDSDIKQKFIEKIQSEIGKTSDSNGETPYGIWWAGRVNESAFRDAPWCAMFLSWCAKEVGLSEQAIGYYAACSYWQDFYKGNGRWHDANGYTPQVGDLVFFDYDNDGVSTHNGVVESVTDAQIEVLEGNVDDVVGRVSYELSDATILGYGTPDYENNVVPTEDSSDSNSEETGAAVSGQAEQILQKAIDELGYAEQGGYTKYGEWYGNHIGTGGFSYSAWCAMFVSWCANKVGISESVIKPYARCYLGYEWFKAQGTYHDASGYTPKKGDIFFYKFRSDGSGHTGLVEYVADGYIHTVEGNKSNMVKRDSYPIGDPQLKGFASPNYQ